jgi:hypothetical protein
MSEAIYEPMLEPGFERSFEAAAAEIEALPPRARLLHIGMRQTGTTALQATASRRRPLLMRHGVLYPGDQDNQRQAAFALMRRPPSQRRKRPDDWDRLLAEVEGERCRRVFISHELIADWESGIARRFTEDLGLRTHVLVTVRNFASWLPSVWLQYVQTGLKLDFEQFLSAVLSEHADPARLPPNFDRPDPGRVVNRWADIVGAENVTVVLVDKARPTRAWAAIEALLGLPSGLLADSPQRDHPDRQSQLPLWAAEAAAARGQEHAEAIRQAVVRVIGDLDELGRTPVSWHGRLTLPEAVPTELAAHAASGALSPGLSHGSNSRLPGRARPQSRAPSTAALMSRVRGFLRAVRRQRGKAP